MKSSWLRILLVVGCSDLLWLASVSGQTSQRQDKKRKDNDIDAAAIPWRNDDFDAVSSWMTPDTIPHHLRHSHRDSHRASRNLQVNKIQIKKCLDATTFFSTHHSEGVNLLTEFYDCQCSGNLSDYFTLHCTLEDFCFEDKLKDDGVVDATLKGIERCFNRNVTYGFVVQESYIVGVQQGYICVDYLTGGPNGHRLCYVDSSICAAVLNEEQENYTMVESTEICDNATRCQGTLTELGYEEIQRAVLCPSTTMDGIQCHDHGRQSGCLGFLQTGDLLGMTTPDCSNVDPCAAQVCQPRRRINTSPSGNLPVFAECNTEEDVVFSDDINVGNGSLASTPPIIRPSSSAPSRTAKAWFVTTSCLFLHAFVTTL